MGATTTNGDGFGVGWYGAAETPGLFRSTEPAWNDLNLRELCAHAAAGRVFAHIRASTGSAVQQTNCHPFRHDNWLWMHNGYLAGFHEIKRDLAMEVDPALFADIAGLHRLRDALLPRAELRAARGPARRAWRARSGWSRRWAAATASASRCR